MSFYNMINGVKPLALFILPMLGMRPHDFPRFRDCFTEDEEYPEYDDHIHVYTRTGGGNRKRYGDENAEITEIKGFVADFDDPFDPTYASWIFEVPEEYKTDFELVKAEQFSNLSPQYQRQVKNTYPEFKEDLDQLFNSSPKQQD